jgi:predicted outer membrane repeat protein
LLSISSSLVYQIEILSSTFTNNAGGSSMISYQSSGFYATHALPSLRAHSSVFSMNTYDDSLISIWSSSHSLDSARIAVSMILVTFERNSAVGCIHLFGYFSDLSNFLGSSIFRSNTISTVPSCLVLVRVSLALFFLQTQGNGAAVYLEGMVDQAASIDSCQFIGNSASYGGAIYTSFVQLPDFYPASLGLALTNVTAISNSAQHVCFPVLYASSLIFFLLAGWLSLIDWWDCFCYFKSF